MSDFSINSCAPVSRVDPAADAKDKAGQLTFGATIANAGESVTDAAEEIGSFFAEDVEKKTLEERNLETFAEPRLLQISEIEKLLQAMHDEAALQDIASFAARLISMIENRISLMTILGPWGEGDSSKQYLALSYALNLALAQGKNARIVTALQDAIERLLDVNGPEIHAGVNTVEQAAAFGPTAAAVDVFRATYRDAVLGEPTFAGTLKLVLDRFGEEVERGVALLRQALGADLASVKPSREPERLHAILRDLSQLTAAVSVLQRCRAITDWLDRSYPIAIVGLSPLSLMKDLVNWTTEAWVLNYHAMELVQKYRIGEDAEQSGEDASEDDDERPDEQNEDEEEPGLAAKIAFLNGILNILRDLPALVFTADEQRLRAISSVQHILDSWLLEEES